MIYQRKTKPALWRTAFPEQQQIKKPKRKIRRVTDRRKEERLYAKEAREFVATERRIGKTCPVVEAYPDLLAMNEGMQGWIKQLTQVHHIRGRRGELLRDKRFWMAVSQRGHDWIHNNPNEARERGWLAQNGDWNKSA